MRAAIVALVLALLALGGCGGAPSPVAKSATPIADAGASSPSAPSAPASSLPSLESLAARGASVAPGLAELTRGELATSDASAFPLLHDAAKDTCLRVVFVADPAVHVSLIAVRSRDVLAEGSDASVVLGARGPVCIRRGDGVDLKVDAKGPWTARFVAFSSS